jgi:hypothetical protein
VVERVRPEPATPRAKVESLFVVATSNHHHSRIGWCRIRQTALCLRVQAIRRQRTRSFSAFMVTVGSGSAAPCALLSAY